MTLKANYIALPNIPTKMVQNDPKWPKMAQNDRKWHCSPRSWNLTCSKTEVNLSSAWVTRLECPKGVKDEVKQARRAKRVAEGHQLEIGAQRAPRFLVIYNRLWPGVLFWNPFHLMQVFWWYCCIAFAITLLSCWKRRINVYWDNSWKNCLMKNRNNQ